MTTDTQFLYYLIFSGLTHIAIITKNQEIPQLKHIPQKRNVLNIKRQEKTTK